MESARNSQEAFQYWTGTFEEWNRQWDQLLAPGEYEVTLADQLLPALSHCIGLDIMIFNTYKGENAFSGANGPILLAHSDCWGGEPTQKPPVILGYNGVHYENLNPMTVEDERKTKVLFGKLKRSEVTLKYEQFSIFQDIEEEKLKN